MFNKLVISNCIRNLLKNITNVRVKYNFRQNSYLQTYTKKKKCRLTIFLKYLELLVENMSKVIFRYNIKN